MMTYQALDAIAHASRLHQAGLDDELQRYYHQLTGDGIDEIRPWLSQLLLRSAQYDADSLPDSVYQRCEGWRAYFQGQYIKAYEYFQHSIADSDWQRYAYDAALGMAKVYTRSGQWQLAQDWALYYLSLARSLRDDFGLTKGYGALAEIYLRGDQPRAALACFQIANQLMPLGQGQLDKQYNFLASALMRNGEWLRAETLLRNSIKMSTDKLGINPEDMSAKISYLHSWSRLSYLHLERQQDICLPERVKMLLSELTHPALFVPAGFVLSALAIQAIRYQQYHFANDYLASSLSAFGKSAAMEYQWVLRLQQALSADTAHAQTESTSYAPCQQLLELSPIAAPDISIVVDNTWANIELDNAGYQPLITEQESLESLTEMWRLFFI
ncbi:tetratricopeptide repeat protein [Psychrobacter jeotgali]|uniref:tetratricopeptide repeat protein n=1 Tax=Psychrobacter jeotgali TaxID=179010 RepID=UPI0019184907|nr:hypothetical protein [Psychrobacter jeotgali]